MASTDVSFYQAHSNGDSSNSVGGRSPTGSVSGSAEECDTYTMAQLLGMAIKKRRRLLEERERDIRRELLHSHLIRSLCKCLGEGRAKVRRQRRLRRKCSARNGERVGIERADNDRDQVVPDSRSPNSLDLEVAFEQTVQNPNDVRVRCLRETSNDRSASEFESPRKRTRWDCVGDVVALTDL